MQILRSVVAKSYRSFGKRQSRVFSSSPRNNGKIIFMPCKQFMKFCEEQLKSF
ncbi:unnamed protein product [Arabidopsis halleri]